MRAMPAVFVLIWSTGFVVARYGMPHAPPLRFLALRFALSMLRLRRCGSLLARAALAARPRAVAASGRHRRADACRLPGRRVGAVKAGAGRRHGGADRRPAAGADGAVGVAHAAAGSRVAARQWVGLVLGLAGLLLVVWHKLGRGEVTAWNLSLCADGAAGASPPARCTRSASSRLATCAPPAWCSCWRALLVTLPLALLETEADAAATPRADRRHGLVGAGADAGRQLAAVPADPARCGHRA